MSAKKADTETGDTPAPKAGKPRQAATHRAAGATFENDKLTVRTADGSDVAVPAGATVYLNGFARPAASVPAWLEGHAKVQAENDEFNKTAAERGFRTKATLPVHFTLADADDGPVARFDQRG